MKPSTTKEAVYAEYRLKYVNAPKLNLEVPVDISVELSSVCNMACSYCLDPETPVLTTSLGWVPIKELKEGDEVVGFDEFSPGNLVNRQNKKSIIEKVWETKKETVRINTTDGEIICSLDHKFLDALGRWVEARNLKVGRQILFGCEPWENVDIFSKDYMRGYLEAMTIGDGTARWQPLPGATGQSNDSRRQVWWRVALRDRAPLERMVKYLDILNIQHPGIKPFYAENGNYSAIEKLEIRSKESLNLLYDFIYNHVVENQSIYEKGYLAGIFDAEGSYNQTDRISQKQDNDVCDRTIEYLDNLEFNSVREQSGVRILGGKWEMIRFLGTVQTCINRKNDNWNNTGVQHKKSAIISIENLGEQKLIDIQTSTRTFYGAGFATHNCYHADKANLPFKQRFMSPVIFKTIINQAADMGVHSVKTNWRGESTLNPWFCMMTTYLKERASGGTFIDRLTNSNFKFDNSKEDIFKGLCNQTKVKVSYDSFRADVFETQRTLGDHALTTANIDKFYNYPGRDNILVIQAVRTSKNADEDIEGEARKRWPSALISIRDMVEGRVNKDLDAIKHKERDFTERQSCIQAHARLIFDWDGTAMPCCPDIRNDLALGNIRQMPLRKIFTCAKAKQLRADLISGEAFKSDPCKNCSSFETFKGYVPAFDS